MVLTGAADEPGRVLQLPVPAAGGARGGRGGVVDAPLRSHVNQLMNYASPSAFWSAALRSGCAGLRPRQVQHRPDVDRQRQRHGDDDGRAAAADLSVRRLEGHRAGAAPGATRRCASKSRRDTWIVAGTGDPANRSSFTSLIVAHEPAQGDARRRQPGHRPVTVRARPAEGHRRSPSSTTARRTSSSSAARRRCRPGRTPSKPTAPDVVRDRRPVRDGSRTPGGRPEGAANATPRPPRQRPPRQAPRRPTARRRPAP